MISCYFPSDDSVLCKDIKDLRQALSDEDFFVIMNFCNLSLAGLEGGDAQ